MPDEKAFVDSNIFIYAYSKTDSEKRQKSQEGNQSHQQKQECIHQLCGKYKDSTFSTKRYLQKKRREKELEK